MKKIYFRADAGAAIGYGHFVRTLALADMLKDDFECVFVTQNPSDYQRAEVDKVCQLVAVPASDEKFPAFLEMLEGNEIVVLDNYFYDTEYQRAIKDKGCRLVCIDDRKHQHFYADVIINHVIGTTAEDVVNLNSAELLLGPQYALLRRPFISAMQGDRNHVILQPEVLIAMGGTDYNNMTGRVLDLLLPYGDYKINLLLGDSYKYENGLVGKPVRIYKNCLAEELIELIRRQKLVICTPSTLAYEVCAVGCLLVVGSFADNHIAVEKALAEYGLAVACGKFAELTAEQFDFLFKKALCDVDQLEKQSYYFDGKQKERFCSCFQKLI